ncbi:hypothetical protein GCM10010124_30350 [Pilimelia terevasa]|uniref:DUF559 domain-containing protein n=1 Tax=Pilimelia terevasa TaxID=53372 RepID=A0A8J3BSK1_9ACTN|nr:hypothetical protein [Pilimelia terevasa]GGK35579.1 hypothetical protein GCM10010124_30350 [Pilimelia terevasa]
MQGLAEAERTATGQDGVLSRWQALRGGLAAREVDALRRSRRWWPMGCGTYFVASPGHPRPGRRAAIRAVQLSLGPDAVLVHDTAAEWFGLVARHDGAPVHVAAPGRRGRAAGPRGAAVVHQWAVPAAARTTVAGLRVTTARRTVADLLRVAARDDAVAVLDAALHRSLVGADDLAALPALLRGRRGAVAARARLALADGRAACGLETLVRLRCVDGGVPPEELQVPVRDRAGRIVTRGALGWPSRGLIVEADGVPGHRDAAALDAARQRHNRIADAGWRMLRFAWRDTARPGLIPRRVRAALDG